MPPRKDKVLSKIVAPPEVKKRGKKSESAASEEVEIQEKRRFVWTSDCKQALVNAYESRWNSVFSKPVSQSDAWKKSAMSQVVAAVPPITVNIQYLDAEKCKTKLKNIRTAVQDYTNNLEGKTGTGSEACEKPEFYDQFRRFMRGSVVTQGPVKIRDSGTGTQPIMRTAADSLPAKLSINEEDLPNIASEEGLMIDFLATANKDSDFVQRQKRQTERLNTWIKQPFDLNSPIPLLSSSPTKNNAPELDRPDIPLPTCTIESTKIRKEDPEKPQPTPKQKRKRGTGDNDDYQERQLEIQQQTLDLNREVAKQNQERHEANLKLQLDIQETNRQNRIVDAAKDRAAQEKADEKYAMMMEALLKKMRD